METQSKIRTDEELAVLLKSLGATAGRVAEFLMAAGVTGRREQAEVCPVANWLAAETGADDVEVDWQSIGLRFRPLGPDDSPAGQDWYCLSATPTAAVRLFVKQFDRGDFPELEEPDERSFPGRIPVQADD